MQKKRREKKKLSETELRRVMTDTKETLVPLTDYISCSVHLGTKVITPDMRKYVYKRRADGLAVLNTNLIDDKLREASKFLNQFAYQSIKIEKNTRVQYSNPYGEPCEYLAICKPAFDFNKVHREKE